jgi:plastocyanin
MKNLKTLIVLLICGTMTSIAFAANITGTVTYDKTEPTTRTALEIKTQEQHCIDATKGAKSEELVVSKGKGIQNVVIYARVSGQKVTPLKENPKVDQKDCRYLPHVLVVPEGTTVDVTSDDPVAHNVHSHAAKNDAPNFQIPKKGITVPYTITKAEAIKLTCDIHAWMSGYIVAVKSNHYTVTGQKDDKGNWIHPDDYEKSDDTGKYTIKDVPAGKARIIAWHEKLGSANKTVEIPASGDLKVDFKASDFKPPKTK